MKIHQNRSKWNPLLFPIVPPAVILFIVAVINTYQSQKVKFWDTHEAVLDSVMLGHPKNRRLNDHSQRVDVYYSYGVGGQCYSSDEIAYGYMASNFLDDNRAIYELLKDAYTVRV